MRALCLTVLAACGTDPKAIELVVPGAPLLFEGKIAGGGWQTFSGVSDGAATTYTLSLDGDFELLLVSRCNAVDSASELFGTLDDAEVSIGSWSFRSCVASEPGAAITVVGTLLDATDLALDATIPYHNFSGESGYPFIASTVAGPHDLVLWNDARLAIIHDVPLTDGVDVGAMSLAAGSSPIYTQEFAVPVDIDEDATTLVRLQTRNGTRVNWSQAPEHVFYMPPDQLAPGDVETFQFVAYAGESSSRYATASRISDLPAGVELLPRVASVSGAADALSVTWTPFDDYFTSATARNGARAVTMTKLWLERHPGPIAFDEATPGYDSNSRVPAERFEVTRWNADVTVTSATSSILH
ncbi:MAG: hypothetical protein ABI678_08815 [Kofleriaceae bacterium]